MVTAEYATFGRRTAALLLDWLLLGIAACVASMGAEPGWIIFAVLVIVYEVGLTAEGGTLGKRLLGLRVVRADGSKLGVGQSIVRAILRPFSISLLGVGCLWMLDQRNRQGWHDIAASSVVVRERLANPAPEWGHTPPWTDVAVPVELIPMEQPLVAAQAAAQVAAHEPDVTQQTLIVEPDAPDLSGGEQNADE